MAKVAYTEGLNAKRYDADEADIGDGVTAGAVQGDRPALMGTSAAGPNGGHAAEVSVMRAAALASESKTSFVSEPVAPLSVLETDMPGRSFASADMGPANASIRPLNAPPIGNAPTARLADGQSVTMDEGGFVTLDPGPPVSPPAIDPETDDLPSQPQPPSDPVVDDTSDDPTPADDPVPPVVDDGSTPVMPDTDPGEDDLPPGDTDGPVDDGVDPEPDTDDLPPQPEPPSDPVVDDTSDDPTPADDPVPPEVDDGSTPVMPDTDPGEDGLPSGDTDGPVDDGVDPVPDTDDLPPQPEPPSDPVVDDTSDDPTPADDPVPPEVDDGSTPVMPDTDPGEDGLPPGDTDGPVDDGVDSVPDTDDLPPQPELPSDPVVDDTSDDPTPADDPVPDTDSDGTGDDPTADPPVDDHSPEDEPGDGDTDPTPNDSTGDPEDDAGSDPDKGNGQGKDGDKKTYVDPNSGRDGAEPGPADVYKVITDEDGVTTVTSPTDKRGGGKTSDDGGLDPDIDVDGLFGDFTNLEKDGAPGNGNGRGNEKSAELDDLSIPFAADGGEDNVFMGDDMDGFDSDVGSALDMAHDHGPHVNFF
ncbi:hypothetical protein C8J27_101526 [Rhodobacter aestuarii]|uniref:Uncharacterized protein n=1 Tax=Rhodobacter aestuarii TaxID=453582 RepID=A0A1N7IY55_9RHOB|nr:hypothetical protein [Rhodobacter aestuarii]PTV97411.1 hypothetical protein C8J27_101526 [Rhodobacter aestuarii]SIS41937.1 hypothetical protein SAMN05421580_101116 [Rhodobacter aestuarii]